MKVQAKIVAALYLMLTPEQKDEMLAIVWQAITKKEQKITEKSGGQLR